MSAPIEEQAMSRGDVIEGLYLLGGQIALVALLFYWMKGVVFLFIVCTFIGLEASRMGTNQGGRAE